MATQLAERDDLVRERNLYKGKYRALLKLIIKTRGKLVQVTDHIDDEGDRVYFGSTNHADTLKELYHEMMSWIWDATDETNRMKSDPYADIRKQRARAVAAEKEVQRLRNALERLALPEAFTVSRMATAEETARMKFAEASLNPEGN